MIYIEDEIHGEQDGPFDSFENAIRELERRASIAWDKAPNIAPCTSWQSCGREYHLIEYDETSDPWKLLRNVSVLKISAGNIGWIEGFEESWSGQRERGEVAITLSTGHSVDQTTERRVESAQPSIWNLPNTLTTARLFLAVILFGLIWAQWWIAGLATFIVAAFTDWLDGYIARKQGLLSAFGRNFDPLVDKILVCGTFIFLLAVPAALLAPWIVTLVVTRELVVTGLRGYFEARDISFGADMFGKVKMVTQCAALISILMALTWPNQPWLTLQPWLIYAMALATGLSGLQYVIKAVALLRRPA